MLIRYRLRSRINKVGALAVIALMCAMPQMRAESANDPALLKRQETLISQRADLLRGMQNAELQLRKVELDRKDKLEELEQLCSAQTQLDQKHSFSKNVDNEITDQTRNLRAIERQRSDCLEELETLYMALSKINRDIADGDKQLR
jgi:hypothetical protein